MPKKILVVDDDEDILELISYYLQEKYTLLQASFVSDALYIFQRESVDLLIVDYFMAPRNGMYFVKEVRKLDQKTPVIMISGYATTGLEPEMAENNIAVLMPKPLERAKLLECVAQLL